MKRTGLVLIGAGFLGGALLAVLQVESVAWLPYAAAIGAGAVGLFLYRRSIGAAAGDQVQVHGDLAELRDALDGICDGLEEMSGRRDAIPAHEFRFEIDRRFRDHLTRFAASRDAMKHAFGLQTYADIMSAFAAGERYVNRIWTASADGYVDEVMTYLEKARAQFLEARETFDGHRRSHGPAPAVGS